MGAKLLTASTALRAYRNRHSCDAVRRGNPWENALIRFLSNAEFHGPSQIISSSTRENLAEREAEKRNFSWTHTEKDNALAKCSLGLRAWRAKKPMLCLHAVTDEDDHPSGRRRRIRRKVMIIGLRFSKHAPKDRGITSLKISCDTLKKLLMISAWLSTRTRLTNSWPQRNLLSGLVEFRPV